jgi:hypothetical protein
VIGVAFGILAMCGDRVDCAGRGVYLRIGLPVVPNKRFAGKSSLGFDE